jgi:hypothetical protein
MRFRLLIAPSARGISRPPTRPTAPSSSAPLRAPSSPCTLAPMRRVWSTASLVSPTFSSRGREEPSIIIDQNPSSMQAAHTSGDCPWSGLPAVG